MRSCLQTQIKSLYRKPPEDVHLLICWVVVQTSLFLAFQIEVTLFEELQNVGIEQLNFSGTICYEALMCKIIFSEHERRSLLLNAQHRIATIHMASSFSSLSLLSSKTETARFL